MLMTIAWIGYSSASSGPMPSKLMKYFLPYKGEWTSVDNKNLTDGKPLRKTTKCWFSHGYSIFTIFSGFSSGQISFSDSVTIYSQRGIGCHAVLYQSDDTGYTSTYFRGTPDKDNKVFVMETMHPKTKSPHYLMIDFSLCPKKPPTYRTSKEKPKG